MVPPTRMDAGSLAGMTPFLLSVVIRGGEAASVKSVSLGTAASVKAKQAVLCPTQAHRLNRTPVGVTRP